MNPTKSKLSKSILQMKFMKRTKEKVEKQMIEKEGEEYFSGQLSIQMKNESEKFIIEPSYVFCEKLIDGRLSFQGMNPELEKLLEIENVDKQIELEKKQEADVTDEQMVKQWINLRKKKNKFKRTKKIKNNINQPLNKNPKFLKPID
ncbi:M-phase phosphoprotein 6-like [Vespa mandarinia]|uniref:M-phase phosphoprotein 6-like n=1 Tax=Vespa mandarinia TaxID=7446 RepID=UPI00162012BA|nr:M-phase phosphoprotein 6-like [Vespa mandarinia]